MKIIFLDPESFVRSAVDEAFKLQEGSEVHTFKSLDECPPLQIEQIAPTVIVLEEGLAREADEAFKNALSHIPVVLTSFKRNDDLEDMFSSFKGWLIKPFSPIDLEENLEKLLNP